MLPIILFQKLFSFLKNMSRNVWLLAFIHMSCVLGKKICVLEDLDCVTRGGFDIYKNVVRGVKGLLKPIDPLNINEIDRDTHSMKYKLTNITLKGLKSCTVTKLK